jgi:hypothetical protein
MSSSSPTSPLCTIFIPDRPSFGSHHTNWHAYPDPPAEEKVDALNQVAKKEKTKTKKGKKGEEPTELRKVARGIL